MDLIMINITYDLFKYLNFFCKEYLKILYIKKNESCYLINMSTPINFTQDEILMHNSHMIIFQNKQIALFYKH